jgi:hypothetical protein
MIHTGLVLLLSGVVAVGADSPPGGDDWKYDIVHRKKGDSYQGLVLDHGGGELDMWCIVRKPGRPTVFFRVRLPDQDIARVEKLPDAEHEVLRRRFEALRQEHRDSPDPLKALDPDKPLPPGADKITLRETTWPGDGKTKALAYRSSYFELVSNARQRTVLVTAIQLEEVYAAYVRFLPPRAPGQCTTILLAKSLADYRVLVRGQGRSLLNPAFFDPAGNQVVCAFDWQFMNAELERVQNYHTKLYADITERENELRKAYRGIVPAEVKAALAEKRKRIQDAEKRNQDTFERARERLFQRLFHEAFHAYLLNFVYPAREGELPRWLNEGLAQIFESAIFEVGELRIGHVDRQRMEALRQALVGNTLLPLTDLLRSGAKQFQVAHNDDKQISDRYYLASWALAYYVTFDRKVLGTPALDAYVRQLQRGGDPLEAFRDLTGQPLAALERDFLHYLNHLRADGRVVTGK